MAIQRIVDTSPHDDAEEQRIEVSLRPQSFSDYVGQERLKKNLKLAIAAAKQRSEPLDMCYCTARQDWARRRWRR